MILKEKHKEFAVKSYANFMQPSDIIDAFMQQFHDDIPKPPQMQQNQDPEEYNYQEEQHRKSIREELRNQLRRYDIRHQEFPKKYRELFHQARHEYVSKFIDQERKCSENIINELDALYGYVMECIHGLTPSDKTLRNAQLALRIIDSITKLKSKIQ